MCSQSPQVLNCITGRQACSHSPLDVRLLQQLSGAAKKPAQEGIVVRAGVLCPSPCPFTCRCAWFDIHHVLASPELYFVQACSHSPRCAPCTISQLCSQKVRLGVHSCMSWCVLPKSMHIYLLGVLGVTFIVRLHSSQVLTCTMCKHVLTAPFNVRLLNRSAARSRAAFGAARSLSTSTTWPCTTLSL